ncbi:M3 family oligoendopeptidase [Salmonella enterica]|nr:M3 family oligoendopeptidase [Salmonella enterica]VEA96349.1 putative membrane protein [Salmonella enterica subsp. houtenae]
MTTTTASTVDIPSDNDLTLSAHLTEPAEPTIDMPEIPVAPGNSAQSAAQRLGGKGGHSWPPSSDRRALMLKVLSVLVFCVLLGAVLFLWFTVRQQQIQLTTLDAAFRSGQLQTLPDRMRAIEDRQQQYVLKSQSEKWQQSLSEQAQSLATFQQQLSSLATDVKDTHSGTARVVARLDDTDMKLDALQNALNTQTLRIDALETWKEAWNKRSASVTTKTVQAPGGSPSSVKKQLKPRPRKLTPPFSLVSTELRGGQTYAVILPAGEGGWAQLRMLSPGESVSGWTLVNVSSNHAEFQVNGQVQRLTL